VPWWSGFEGKTLWDILDLLIVPIVLAVGAFLLSRAESRTEREIAAERRREDALQNYLDKMAELMLEKGLRQSEGEPEDKETYEAARDVARARTLTVLRVLDGERKGILLRFLHESELIQKQDEQQDAVVTLHWADLSGAGLLGADLGGAYLRVADLLGADLRGTYLGGAELGAANLLGADLRWANLSWANLLGADLRGANLGGAYLERAELGAAIFHENTTLPNGTKWTPDTDMARFTDPKHPDFWRPGWLNDSDTI